MINLTEKEIKELKTWFYEKSLGVAARDVILRLEKEIKDIDDGVITPSISKAAEILNIDTKDVSKEQVVKILKELMLFFKNIPGTSSEEDTDKNKRYAMVKELFRIQIKHKNKDLRNMVSNIKFCYGRGYTERLQKAFNVYIECGGDMVTKEMIGLE